MDVSSASAFFSDFETSLLNKFGVDYFRAT